MGHLTEDEKKFYQENGYIVVKNLISGELLERISAEYDQLFQRKNQEYMESSWVGSDANDRKSDSALTVKGIHNLQLHHSVFSEYLFHDGQLDVLEDVLGSPNIALHHTKAHLKPPEKGAAYPMHQDYHYFPFKRDSMVAAFLLLDDASPANGGLFVYPGSHKLGPLEDVGAKQGDYHFVDQEKFSFEGATPVVASRGDVIVFSYLLVHGSTPNPSPRARRMLLTQVYEADDEPAVQSALRPGQGWMLRGVNYHRDARISKRFEN